MFFFYLCGILKLFSPSLVSSLIEVFPSLTNTYSFLIPRFPFLAETLRQSVCSVIRLLSNKGL